LGYATSTLLLKAVEKDTTIVHNELLVVLPQQLKTVSVTSERKPDTLVGSQAFTIFDFELLNDSILFLASKNQLKRSAFVALKVEDSGNELIKQNIPKNPKQFFKDYRNWVYVLYDDTIFHVKPYKNQLLLTGIEKEAFLNQIRPINEQTLSSIIYSDYNRAYPKFNYFAYQLYTEETDTFATVTNEPLMELYRSEYKYLSPRDRFEAMKLEKQTGIDREEFGAVMSGFANSMYFEPLYAPAFKVEDSLFIFDHYTNQCTQYFMDGSYPVSYTHLTLPTICSV